MSLERVFNYFSKYDKASFQVVACQGDEPSERDVARFEKRVGFRLPEEFRNFTKSPLGGLYMEVREHLWPRPKEFEVGPFWSFLYGLQVFGIAKTIPDWLDIRKEFDEFGKEGHVGLVPFLKVVGDADRYCFDSRGRILRWSHEEPDRPEVIRRTFSNLLMFEIHELEARKAQKLAQAKTSPRRRPK